MIAQSSFNKGLNVDISKEKRTPDSLLDARNIRITNDESLGFGAVENIKGTKFSFKIPSTFPVYKIEFNAPIVPSVYTITFNQVSTGIITTVNISATTQTSITDIYDQIISSISYSNMSIRIWYNNNYIIISTYEDFTINSTGNIITTTVIESQLNPFIIGWKVIQDYIVIFTTDRSNELDINEVPILGPGQIWVVKYDESNDSIYNDEANNTNLFFGDPLNANHLIYNNQLDFSRANAIMDEVQGRFENPETIRVYWTDGYNKLRSINIKDPQVFATPLSTINVSTSVQLNQPIVKEVLNTGSINNGRVGYFYSLKTNDGAITAFSPVSGLISTNPGDDGNFSQYQQFQGGSIGGNSGKAIKFQITEIDTNFDIIELYYILYEVNNIPTISKFSEEPITSDNMTFIHTGNIINDVKITLAEFLKLRKSFDTCKTLASKNNILFAANTKTSTSDFTKLFDSRVYRFDNTGSLTTHLLKRNGNTDDFTINSYSDWFNIPDNHDAINPFNDESGTAFGILPLGTSALYDAGAAPYNQKYQINGTTIGGTGPNISYRFTTRTFVGDNYLPAGATTPDTSPFFSSETYGGGNEDLGIINQEYTRNGTYDDLKSPYATYMFLGHARGEVYRYGITFYDLEGYPSFTQWISDIKFPFHTDSGFEISNWSADKQRLITIGIKFTLDTTTSQFQSIKDKITGWRFVRVERTEINKTKLGTGVIFDTMTGDVKLADGTVVNPADKIASPGNFIPFNTGSHQNIVKAPNIDFNYYNYKSGDYLKTLNTYSIVQNQYYNTAPSDARWSKYKSITSNLTTRRIINKQFIVDNAATISGSQTGGNPFYNVVAEDGGSGRVYGLGQKLHWLQMGDGINAGMSTISYERYNVSQYGGPSYINRTDNKYISTQHFQPWDPYNQSNPINNIGPTDVFGGDTYTVFYDSTLYAFASFGTTAADYGYTKKVGGDAEESDVMFPCEASFNPYLRQGTHFAKDRDSSNMGAYLFEAFVYNGIYSQENNTEIFLSKPFVFKDQNEQPYTIWASDRKIDGETTDSWRNFRVNNPISVDGQYDQINKIIVFKDRLHFYQNKAFGVAAVEERSLNDSGSISETVLGTGGILARYDYISTETGCLHNTAVVKGLYSLYHFDVLSNKIYKYSTEGLEQLSVTKYINTLIRSLFGEGKIRQKDKPLIDKRCSIVSCFDNSFNNIYFTLFYQRTFTVNGESIDSEFSETISYNELLNVFESKHDHKPSLYLNTGKKMLSTDFNQSPTDSDRYNTQVYMHNKDSYGYIYKQFYDSYLQVLVNKDPKIPKRFDTIEFETNVTFNGRDTSFGISAVQETINKFRVSTDYQQGALTTLVPNFNIRRRFRRWRVDVSRDIINAQTMSSGYNARMRDYWLYLELWYTNNGNKRILIHDILTYYN